MDLTGSFEW